MVRHGQFKRLIKPNVSQVLPAELKAIAKCNSRDKPRSPACFFVFPLPSTRLRYIQLQGRGRGTRKKDDGQDSSFAYLDSLITFARRRTQSPAGDLEKCQILINFPLRHLTIIRLPFLDLEFDQFVGDGTQSRFDDVVALQFFDRFP